MSNINDLLNEIDGCNVRDVSRVSEILTRRETNVMIEKAIREKMMEPDFDSYCNYFNGMFPTRVWEDGMGEDLVQEEMIHPTMEMDFSIFERTMQTCDPNNANNCNFNRHTLPEVSIGALPGPMMYKWGFKTQRFCIANFRHIDKFKEWLCKNIEYRLRADDQALNMFYTMAAIYTAGHKYVLQGTKDAATGTLTPITNDNPRNPWGLWSYNYRERLFPAITDANCIMPLTLESLNQLGQVWADSLDSQDRDRKVATGPRGEPIYELWIDEDWYKHEVIADPQFYDAFVRHLPSNIFSGFNPKGEDSEREVIGNFHIKRVGCLPRFTVDAQTGGLVPVHKSVQVPVEIGTEPVMDYRGWTNAPIRMFGSVGMNQLTMLSRPRITEVCGMDILPIDGSGEWRVRNDYDKECNPELNQPFMENHREMGFVARDPDSTLMGLARARVFTPKPIQDCNLAPITEITRQNNVIPCPSNVGAIGCEPNGDTSASVTFVGSEESVRQIPCGSSTCGDPLLYRIWAERRELQPGYNPFCTGCGEDLNIIIEDTTDGNTRIATATLVDDNFAAQHSLFYIRFADGEQPGENECIRAAICEDDTPTEARAHHCATEFPNAESDQILFYVDSLLSVAEGDTVDVKYVQESDDQVQATISATVECVDQEKGEYVLASNDSGFTCPPEGQYVVVCEQ